MNNIKTLSENEWIIHGKVYDLTKWLSQHPGGSTILNMNRRRDCTELFETYHFMSNKTKYIESKLSTYYVRDANAENEISTIYDWNDPKYKEMKAYLKNRVYNYFKCNNISYKASIQYRLWYLLQFFLILHLIYFGESAYYPPISIMMMGIFGWLFSGDIIHSGGHYSIFDNYLLNELVTYIFGSYHCVFIVWFFQHNISHHSYTNIDGYDADLDWHDDIWYDQDLESNKDETNLVKYKYPNSDRYKWLFLFKVYGFAAPITSIIPILSIVNPLGYNQNGFIITKWIYDKKRFLRLQIFLGYVQVIVLLIIIPFYFVHRYGVAKGFLGYVVIPRFIHGILFHIFSQINHINEFSFQNATLDKSKNFIVHQILSTSDYDVDSPIVGFFSCGLNNQTIHHLFPNIHPCHYPDLSRIVKEFCEKYGIKRSVHNSFMDATISHMKYLFSINIEINDN